MTPFEAMLIKTISPHMSGPPAFQGAEAQDAARRILTAMKEQKLIVILADDICGYSVQWSWTTPQLAAEGRTEADAVRTAIATFTDKFRTAMLQHNMVRIIREAAPLDKDNPEDGERIKIICRADLLLPGFAAARREIQETVLAPGMIAETQGQG